MMTLNGTFIRILGYFVIKVSIRIVHIIFQISFPEGKKKKKKACYLDKLNDFKNVEETCIYH